MYLAGQKIYFDHCIIFISILADCIYMYSLSAACPSELSVLWTGNKKKKYSYWTLWVTSEFIVQQTISSYTGGSGADNQGLSASSWVNY